MMKWFMMVVVAGLLVAAPAVQADCGKCKGGEKTEGCAKGKHGCPWMKGITLTDEQKAKVDEIKAGCDGSKEACGKAKDAIRAVLTEEQQKTFDANCAAGCEKKGGCSKEKAGDKA